MRNRHLRTIIALQLIFLFLITNTALSAKPGHLKESWLVSDWWKRPQILKKMEVSDQQIYRMQEIYQARSKAISEARSAFEKERGRMRVLLTQSQLDDNDIKLQMDALESSLSRLLHAEMEMNYEMAKELTEDQRQILGAIVFKPGDRKYQRGSKQHSTSEKQKLERRYHRF
jgi:Spy/CpxP family protein refolding chaperone